MTLDPKRAAVRVELLAALSQVLDRSPLLAQAARRLPIYDQLCMTLELISDSAPVYRVLPLPSPRCAARPAGHRRRPRRHG